MQKIELSYKHSGQVAEIILNDGKANILDSIMMQDLNLIFKEFKKKTDIKIITFEGAGDHFSFGASVEEHKKENAAVMLKSFHELFYALIDLSIPTLAKISGQCLGGGFELALMCNFIFADKTARMGQPEIILGVFPPPASLILPQKIGNARAEEILITGKSINADKGKEIGLINDVFEDKKTMYSEIEKWITDNILPKSASSLKYAVKASRKMFNHFIKMKLGDLEQLYVSELMETKDANEGINSFLEKRKPNWNNC